MSKFTALEQIFIDWYQKNKKKFSPSFFIFNSDQTVIFHCLFAHFNFIFVVWKCVMLIYFLLALVLLLVFLIITRTIFVRGKT